MNELFYFMHFQGFPAGSEVKKPPAMQESRVQSLGREDPQEEEMAPPTPVFLPEKSPERKSLMGYRPKGHKESDTAE